MGGFGPGGGGGGWRRRLTGTRPGCVSLMGGAAAGRGEMLFRLLWYRMRSLCGKYR